MGISFFYVRQYCTVFTFLSAQKETENLFIVQEAVREKSEQAGSTIALSKQITNELTKCGFNDFSTLDVTDISKRIASTVLKMASLHTYIHTGGRGCHARCSPVLRRSWWSSNYLYRIKIRLRLIAAKEKSETVQFITRTRMEKHIIKRLCFWKTELMNQYVLNNYSPHSKSKASDSSSGKLNMIMMCCWC